MKKVCWQKIFATFVTDKGLKSKMNVKIYKLIRKKPLNQKEKYKKYKQKIHRRGTEMESTKCTRNEYQ